MSFRRRSYEKELLDRPGLPFGDIRRNMQELEVINRRLGGHRITLAGVQRFLSASPEKKIWRIAEVGSGGGDNLSAIRQWVEGQGLQVELTGVDINPECVAYAESRSSNRGIRFLCSDYRQVSFDNKPDIIFSALCCHHFTDEELVHLLQWKRDQSQSGFFINDLHRHPLAFQSIRLLTALFSRSYLVKHDAPLSVRRGFVRSDWDRIFSAAGLRNFSCRWMWAFRWLVTYHHERTAL